MDNVSDEAARVFFQLVFLVQLVSDPFSVRMLLDYFTDPREELKPKDVFRVRICVRERTHGREAKTPLGLPV